MRLAWEQVLDGGLPLEVTMEQQPKRLVRDGRHYELSYKTIHDTSDAAPEQTFQCALLSLERPANATAGGGGLGPSQLRYT